MAVAHKTVSDRTDVFTIDSYDLVVTDEPWPWAVDNASAVKRFWKKALVDKPSMFNGHVLVMGQYTVADACLSGDIHKTDFASLQYFKDKGLPADAGVRNVFGCAVVRSVEGHLLFGRMASHTAASGRVYPMAGTPDLEDVKDNRLDIEGSIRRELREETGLLAADGTRQPGYLLIENGGMCAICAILDFEETSRDLKSRMMGNIDMQDDPELDEIVVFRRAAFHVHHRMPGFARILVQHLLE